MDVNSPPDEGAIAGDAAVNVGRRALLAKGAVAGGVLWLAPTLLSAPVAASSGLVPVYVSSMTGVDGPDLFGFDGPRTVTLTSSVQAGDLVLAVAAYSADGTIVLPPGFTALQTTSEDTGIYSVQAVLASYVVPTTGTFSAVFTTSDDNALYGDLRVAAVVYRGVGVHVLSSSAQHASGPASGRNVTATFPASSVSAPVGTNRVVRFGVGRGYGGLNALNSSMTWTSVPAGTTSRVNFNTQNRGDRVILIADQASGAGASTTAVYDKNAGLAPSNWVTFTAVVETA